MQSEEMAEIKQEVDDEDEHNPQYDVSDITIKPEPDFEADGSYGHTESLSVKGRMQVGKRTGSLGRWATGRPGVHLQDPEMSEEGSIGITVMEQDTNGTIVMVLRNEQFPTSPGVPDHPVVRPAGAVVSKGHDDDLVPIQPQNLFSQTDKSALSVGVEAVGHMETKGDACHKEEDTQHEEGNIGITVMEQDTNGTVVMVLRNEQFPTLPGVPNHPVVRPTGAVVSKGHDDDLVPTQPQNLFSQTDKSAALCEDEIVQEDVKPYLCGVCDMCFTDISELNKHTRQHTEEELYMDDAGCTHDSDVKDENMPSEETLYKCHVCGLEFINRNSLTEHERGHSEGNDRKCCDCGLELTFCRCLKAESSDMSGDHDEGPADHSDLQAQQKRSAGDKRYSCGSCGLEFTVARDLKIHKRTHRGEKPYSCDSCGLEFTVARDLKIHKRTHTGEKPYICDICGMRFTNTLSLAGHHTSHTGDRAYKCDFCGLGFAYKSHLKRHVMIHTGDRPYKCGICGTKFTRSFSLKIHERIHSGHKPYKCDICGQEFTNNGCLKRHAGTHTGEKPYKCDICDVRYAFRSYLKIHKRTHTGEKPFKCDVCGLEFTDNRCLKRHTGIHTGIPRKLYGGANSGEKPYKCDTCDATFAFQRYLKVHERVHTGEKPYKCELCDSRFSHVHTMKEHQRIHTGEKPYICHICNIGFTYKSHLTRHVITHTGERPYKCDICGITFTQSSSLNRHKGVHKEKVVV